jgi:hypothetical protein
MPERPFVPDREEPRVQPKPALGVKIVAGVALGALALVSLVIWAVVKVMTP